MRDKLIYFDSKYRETISLDFWSYFCIPISYQEYDHLDLVKEDLLHGRYWIRVWNYFDISNSLL